MIILMILWRPRQIESTNKIVYWHLRCAIRIAIEFCRNCLLSDQCHRGSRIRVLILQYLRVYLRMHACRACRLPAPERYWLERNIFVCGLAIYLVPRCPLCTHKSILKHRRASLKRSTATYRGSFAYGCGCQPPSSRRWCSSCRLQPQGRHPHLALRLV